MFMAEYLKEHIPETIKYNILVTILRDMKDSMEPITKKHIQVNTLTYMRVYSKVHIQPTMLRTIRNNI